MRIKHYWRDHDALHSGLVTLFALLASAGLLYVLYARRVWQTARQAQTTVAQPGALLVFGKRCDSGQPDADLEYRLGRTLQLVQQSESSKPVLYLLGGQTGGAQSEAAAMLQMLRARGLSSDLEAVLEDQSRDTLQNLRHARDLLRVRNEQRVLLISNRYHLARCSLLAGNLGLTHDLVAAEADASLAAIGLGNVLREAVFLMWLDVGTRYARGMGLKRMLARVT